MTKFVKIADNANAVKDAEQMGCPISLATIPNYMGINLCSVDEIQWERRDDGSLVNVNIVFKD